MLIEAGRKVTGDHENDRVKFLGRAQTMHSPLMLQSANRHLSGTTGGTLDPIFSLAQEIELLPHAKTRVTFLTLAAPSRAEALEKLSDYQSRQSIHRAFDDVRARSEHDLLDLGLNAYSVPPHTGRGGWTWYTGSSGWMYRLGIEDILGITRAGNVFSINPCVSRNWSGFKVDYWFGTTHYKTNVKNPHNINTGIKQILLDGNPLPDNLILLVDDGRSHDVRIVMG